MAMYSAYFDESTNEKSPILVVAGFLSTDAQWGLFETEWKAVLAKFGISAFHMQHFAQRSNEFVGMDEPKRKALLAKLLNIISRRVKLGFASVVHTIDFKQVFTHNCREELRFSLQSVLHSLPFASRGMGNEELPDRTYCLLF
jgi:hypothetical protein